MKKIVMSIIVMLLLITGGYLGGHFLLSKDVATDEALEEFISSRDGVDDISILARDYKEDLLAVLYNDGVKDKLFILEQDKIFKNRYSYFGGGYHSAKFATYNYQDSKYGTLIIAYGNNSEVKAYSYELLVDGIRYRKQNLGNYVVDIYILKDHINIYSEGSIYDKDHNVISYFNSSN